MTRIGTGLIIATCLMIVGWTVGCAITSEEDAMPAQGVSLVTMAFEKSGEDNFTEVELHVTGDGFSPIEVTKSATTTPVEIEVTVPAGKNRTFYVLARNIAGDICYEGSTTVNLNPGPSNVNITMTGRAYFQGVIYLPYADLPSETLPAGGTIQFQIEGQDAFTTLTGENGEYEIMLPVDGDSYEIQIDAVYQSQNVTAYADVELATPGERITLDLYLISKIDVQNPWICAVTPMTAAQGEQIHLYGRGFDNASWRPYLIAFDWEGAQVSATNIITVDDTHLILTVPAGAQNDLVVAGDSGAYPSNRVPF